jgi:hypothetical protein
MGGATANKVEDPPADTSEHPKKGAEVEDPPPDEPLWEIEAGGFRFDGSFYYLTGKPLALLRVFIDSPRRQTFGYAELRQAWREDTVEDSAIRAQLSKLRATLSKVATANGIEVADPLPGNNRTWQFLLPRPSKVRE